MIEQRAQWMHDAQRAKSPEGKGTGREVAAWLDVGYRAVEWWERYAERLTPIERRRILHDDWGPFYRPWKPELDEKGATTWPLFGRRPLPVDVNHAAGGHRFFVAVKVTAHLGRYRITLIGGRDLRAPLSQSVRHSRTSEAISDTTGTLVAFAKRMGEPEGADLSKQWKVASRARRMAAQRDAIAA